MYWVEVWEIISQLLCFANEYFEYQSVCVSIYIKARNNIRFSSESIRFNLRNVDWIINFFVCNIFLNSLHNPVPL